MSDRFDFSLTETRLIKLLMNLAGGPYLESYPQRINELRNFPREATVLVLENLLISEDPILRSRAGEVLLQIDVERSMSAVLRLLYDEDADVQYNISHWLMNFPHPPALEQLIEILQTHPDPDIRANIAVTIGLIGDRKAIQTLEQVAQRDNELDFQGESVASIVKKAIAQINHE